MRVAHWSLKNGSGMGRTGAAMAEAETRAGLDSVLVDCTNEAEWPIGANADVHVVHTHVPDDILHSGKPMVWVAHGTPEVMFHSGYEQGNVNGKYGHGDAWMMAQFWLQHCDATVTFWPRHHAIWQSLADKHTAVHCLPMGIDTAYWTPQPTRGQFAGAPAILTAENCYEIKWPLDLFVAWPWVVKDHHHARLHALYVPKDQHRWWFPLVNRNGASFNAFIGPHVFDPPELRNAFCSTAFYVNLVRYGDFNRIGLEAKATGAKVISYEGNPFADYWIHEGDQRRMAEELSAILAGTVTARETLPVPDVSETVAAMKAIYEGLA